MSQLWHYQTWFGERDVRVKIITFDDDPLASAYLRSSGMTWPLLLDRQLELYRAYGMERASWWQVYGLRSLCKYLRLIFSGRLPGRPGRDWRQLGGDVLIDPQGIVRLHHNSRDPHDRPAPEQIMQAISHESGAPAAPVDD